MIPVQLRSLETKAKGGVHICGALVEALVADGGCIFIFEVLHCLRNQKVCQKKQANREKDSLSKANQKLWIAQHLTMIVIALVNIKIPYS